MRITVFGGSGKTGLHVIRQALARGHSVRALLRTPGKLGDLAGSPGLEVVQGDLLDPEAVARTIESTDVVVNAAGWVKGSPEDLQQRAIAGILAGARRHGVRRLVTLTGAGVRVEGDQPKISDKLVRGLLALVAGPMMRDSEAYVAEVVRTDLDWTVVRAPRLLDAKGKGAWRAFEHVGKESGMEIAREDLATFLLECAEKGSYSRKQPVVSW